MARDEYRFLTFLYYDLVDSTPMSQQLDEEVWRTCLSDFLRICNDVILRHGGGIHGHRGDGSLVYFGLPATQRICAVNAVRAGLELANESERLFGDVNKRLAVVGAAPLRLRVGIHSGRVVIGDIDGQQTATGFALALSERLHACADPNTVVISSSTQELVGERFLVKSVGMRKLKGVDKPVLCFRAISENEDWQALRLPFVGRNREMGWLGDEWSWIGAGPPRVVLISGEAGIGKTRLMSEFRHSLDTSQFIRFTWRCVPELSDNAWHPIIAALRKRLLDPALRHLGDPVARLEALLPAGLSRDDAIPAIAYVLGIRGNPSYIDAHPSSEARREQYLNLLVNALVLESQQQSVLLIVEDVQWIDASTLECLERLSARKDSGPMMILITKRIGISRPLPFPFATRKLRLERLSEGAARSLAVSFPGGTDLDQSNIDQILQRSDGVPLFIEESAHLEIDRCQTTVNSKHGPNQLTDIEAPLPPRLIDLLSERLDRMGDARETAGLAAAIGREFPLRLLGMVSNLDSVTLRQHVQGLVDAGLVLRRDLEGEKFGQFKHALVRDCAYSVILKSRRRVYHSRIASVLETNERYSGSVSADRLAMHHNAADNHEKAFELWMSAGLDARRNSEQLEAISHFSRAERLIPLLPVCDSVERGRQILALHLASVRCHVALEGYSSSEAYRHAELAEKLALKYGSELEIVNARFGLVSWLFVRGNIKEALELAADCLRRSDVALSSVAPDAERGVRESMELGAARASWACGNIEFHLGQFDRAMECISRCITTCRRVPHSVKNMDQNPLVMCLCYQGWYEWEIGDPDRALATVGEAVTLAKSIGRAFSIALSLAFRAAIHLFRGEYAEAAAIAGQSISISEKSRYATWHAWALVLRGRGLSQSDDTRRAGIDDIAEGLKLWRASGAIITRPFMLAQLAEACLLDGQCNRALRAVEEALMIIDRHGDRYYEAAIICVHAQILSRMNEGESAINDASIRFRQSIRLAEERKQYGTALCAAIRLCQLGTVRSDKSTEKILLRTALARIDSGRDTASPRFARELLQEDERNPKSHDTQSA